MRRQLKFFLVSASIFILVCFVIFLVNETVTLVGLAKSIDPLFGWITLGFLLTVYFVFLAVPVLTFLSMPKALRPPKDQESAAYGEYLSQLRPRLKKNPLLKGIGLKFKTKDDINECFKVLDEQADKIIKKTASSVFLTTGISQNGRLDGLMVFLTMTGMVWKVAKIYNQRPSLREMFQLYANVAVTTFVATEIEELDVAEQLEPIIGPVLGGSALSAIPGSRVVVNVVTNSILDGSMNAFLVCRVGVITRRYFGYTREESRSVLRRMASAEAGTMLLSISLTSAKAISDAIWRASKKYALKTPAKVGSAAAGKAGDAASFLKGKARKLIYGEETDGEGEQEQGPPPAPEQEPQT
ncbi:MAG: DUF697 domain-containing protein [Desulfovibrio sp.]|nr:MAG: DUF697 domain-containing protein [Desulfovibrio sp.]